MLPLGFNIVPPEPLPMGSLVECHLATALLGTVQLHVQVLVMRCAKLQKEMNVLLLRYYD